MIVDYRSEAKDRLLLSMLPHVTFNGWSRDALNYGYKELGSGVPDIDLLYPGGMKELALQFGDYIDRKMILELSNHKLETMTVRERIIISLRLRIKLLEPHREAVRRLLVFLVLPGNQLAGLRMTLKTIDTIWYAAGDESTDFNYYTKRGLLAGVYGTAMLYWLSDDTKNYQGTEAFLKRRINEVMVIPKLQKRIVKDLKLFGMPLTSLKNLVS